MVCVVPQGSILGPLLFLIFINDLTSICNFCEIFLFADDTAITAIYKQQQEIQIDLDSIADWVKTYRLAISFNETVQVNLISNLGLTFEIDGTQVESKPVCKYLGMYVDFELFFDTHVNVLEKLGKQSGIVSELRCCVSRCQLILFYKTSIQPTIQYGELINGCCSYTSLLPTVKSQRKIVRLITLKKGFSVFSVFHPVFLTKLSSPLAEA